LSDRLEPVTLRRVVRDAVASAPLRPWSTKSRRNGVRFHNWRDEYQRKLVSAEEAVSGIKSGDTVSIPLGREPEALGLALAARGDELSDVKIMVYSPGLDFGWYDPGWEEIFKVKVGFVFPRGIAREWIDARRGDFQVGSVAGAHPYYNENPLDAVLVEVSPPDNNGFCSFGASLWDKREQIGRARLVLAEVNKRLIRTHGDNFVHVSDIDYFVEHTRSGGWGASTHGKPVEHVTAIAGYVNELIRDGDTLQVGAGTTSEALVEAGAFAGKQELGVHTEMTPRGIVRLIREGVITGARKSIHTGKLVAAAVGGSREDMEFIDGNPTFELFSVYYVVDIRTIASNDNMVAINNALAVDLTGQIASESLGPRMWSGAGGQPSFAIGAMLSRGGRSITVLPSRAVNGTLSRIVSCHAPGTIITVPRTAADYVVTEYGVASLRGRSQRERAEALIAIAHPDFRVELGREARTLYWP
jgi:4-hydroxybutyrate CoA-transferase